MKTTANKLGQFGMVTDHDAHDLPLNAWSSLSNIRCKRGYITPMDGHADVTSVPNPNGGLDDPFAPGQPIYIHQLAMLATDTNFYIVFPIDSQGTGVANEIWYYDQSTSLDITREPLFSGVPTKTRYTGTVSDLWQMTEFNGMVILTNGVDAPQYWNGDIAEKCSYLPYDGTASWVAVSGSDETEFDTDGDASANPYRAKVIRAFGAYLFALNITEGSTHYPQMVHWSNPADPGTVPSSWDYRSASNDAGRTVLAETNGEVVDAVPLGDQLIIYKEDAIYRCAEVGGQFIFDFELVTKSHGLWAANCAVDIGQRHVCLGDGVVFIHSGGEPKNILEGRDSDLLFDAIDSSQYQKVFLFHHKAENEVWICYPETGNTWANKALIWNYQYDTWYTRDIPNSASIKTGVISTSSAGNTWNDVTGTWAAGSDAPWVSRTFSPIGDTAIAASKQLVKFGVGSTSDPVYARRTDILMGNPDDWKMAREIIPHASGDAFAVRIGTQAQIGDSVMWSSQKTFAPGTSRKLNFRETGPVHALLIEGSGNWKISAYTLDFEKAGNR